MHMCARVAYGLNVTFLVIIGTIAMPQLAAAQLSGWWTSANNTGCLISNLYFYKEAVGGWLAFMPPDASQPDAIGRWKLTGNRVEMRLEEELSDGHVLITGTLANNRLNVRVSLVEGRKTESSNCTFNPG